MHVAITRQLAGSDRRSFYPSQRITLGEVLDAYGRGSAYVNHRDDSGTIALGQAADLAIADRKIAAAHDLVGAAVDMTFVAGEVVHER